MASGWSVATTLGRSEDVESGSSVSVDENSMGRVVKNMLRRGMSVNGAAEIAEIDVRYVEIIQQSMPVTHTNPSSPRSVCCVDLDMLFEYPKHFLCFKSGKLMNDPVVGADGHSYERGTADGPCNVWLKEALVDFKAERAASMLSGARGLISTRFPVEGARLLTQAADLIRSVPESDHLLKAILDLSVKLPGDRREQRMELVHLMADRQEFSELARRFQELDVAAASEKFSIEQARAMFAETRQLAQTLVGDEHRAAHIAAGRMVVTKLRPVITESVAGLSAGSLESEDQVMWQAEVAERQKLLMELYDSEADEDVCEELASSIAFSMPEAELQKTIEVIDPSTLERVVKLVSPTLPSARACRTLIAASNRLGPPTSRDLLRQVYSAENTWTEARAGLIEMLLKDLELGIATMEATRELAQLLIDHGAFDTIVDKFDALGPSLELSSLGVEAAQSLCDSLVQRGNFKTASSVALVQAQALEADGSAEKAMQFFSQAFRWDDGSQASEDGLKRVALEARRERDAAAELLASLAWRHEGQIDERLGNHDGQCSCGRNGGLASGVAESRVADAMMLIDAHLDGLVKRAVKASADAFASEWREREEALEAKVREHEVELEKRQKELEDLREKLDAPSSKGVIEEAKHDVIELRETMDKMRLPWVNFSGFKTSRLNQGYFLDRSHIVNGYPTYWTEKRDFFISKDPGENTWFITDKYVALAVCYGSHFMSLDTWEEHVNGEYVAVNPVVTANFLETPPVT
eukprot:TRINITY_DN63491_c0_g1_i1.p1 TRINITY_DN63491_c0_g1~~TRINITY_DN63491_c0_g1_i1.p1  ORF type:complete len:755 (+),score=158.68 TRINITY_DN63491_c0_g1_i1:81-2345(+)